MRTLVRVRIDTDRGNDAITSGRVEKVIGGFVERHKPEAAYFFADKGTRSASFVLDMKDSSEIPVIAEPFFIELGAEVEFTPVMNLEDLQKGLNVFAGS
jgi:hypothetical protein